MADKHKTKLAILKNIPLFNDLSESDLDIIAPIMKPVSFAAGEDVIHEGEAGHSLYIISRGSVEVFTTGGTGEKVSLGIMPQGAFFGELSLFDDHPRSATVRAVEDTEFFNISRDDMKDCMENHAELANVLYRNTIIETFSRFRRVTSNFTFLQHHLHSRDTIINELDRDLRAASEVQNYFVRAEDDESINRNSGVVRHFIYLPSKAVGGDFISILNDPAGNICVIIADVEGHGISASLATGVLKSAFSFLAPEYGSSPELFMSKLNNHLCGVLNNLYATCYFAYFDTVNRNITFAKAGHHHPFFWRSENSAFVDLDFSGPVLGLIPGAEYESETYEVKPGDKILFYTDGIVEQHTAGSPMYGPERLAGIFERNMESDGNRIISALIGDLCEFANCDNFDDDITLLLYEFH